ncbi:MAG: hypothetical protein E7459_01745 [Ruminococcaceae bacterium]|nr:hypothetical protein [Oscillospiraceae bacterium]
MKRKYRLVSLVFLAVLVAGVATCLWSCGKAPVSPEETAERQLSRMGVTDAVFLGELTHEVLENQVLSYSSQENGYTYSFDPETALLRSIEDTDGEYPEDLPELSAEERDAQVMAQVTQWLQPYMVGEFRVFSQGDNNFACSYTFEEHRDGYPTGMSVFVYCTHGGYIQTCDIIHGGIFTKKPNGDIALVDSRPLIAEEEATAIGIAAATEAMEESSFPQTLLPEKTACTLRATGDRLFYYVEVYSQIEGLYEGYYQVLIDPYDGTVQKVAQNN